MNEIIQQIFVFGSKGTSKTSDKDFFLLLVLCLLFGFFGMHRFYCGKIKSGIFMILTFGGLYIWAFVDLIIVCLGEFTDAEGKKITYNKQNIFMKFLRNIVIFIFCFLIPTTVIFVLLGFDIEG
mgnify:CR=1 FL=1